MERFLYLTTTGRVSSLPRTIEIWFVERGGRYYVVSERAEQSGWVKNVERDPRVRFRVGVRGNEAEAGATGTARVVREANVVVAVKALMNAKYGWSDGLVVKISP